MGGFMNEVLGKQKKFQPVTEPIDIPPVELKQDDTHGNKVATTTTTTATTNNNSNGNDNNTLPRGGMINARVLQMSTPNSVQVQQQGNEGLNATKTTETTPESKYKPVVLPHLDKSQEEKTLEDYIKDIKRLTPEEKEKAYKKAKRKALFSAIGDGVNALANIVGTSYGSTYIPQVSLTEGQKKRWDERMKKLKDNEEKYHKYERERARLADNRKLKNVDIDLKNEQHRRETDLANLEYNIKQYGLESAQAQAGIDQLKLYYTPAELQAKVEEINSRTKLNEDRSETEKTNQGKNKALTYKYNQEGDLAGERIKYVGKSTKGTVVITDGETEYELPNNVLENSYVQLYKDIIKDNPLLGKTEGGLGVKHTAAEKWDIVRTHWMESPTAMGTLAKMANTIDGTEIEEYE